MDTASQNGILEDFRIEFNDCWRRLPNKAFFFGLLAAWVAVFCLVGNSTLGYIHTNSLLVWMYQAYNPKLEGIVSEDAHGNFIPFLVLALLWIKRKTLIQQELRLWWPAVFVVAFSLLLHMFGYAVQQSRISVLALFLGIYGLGGLAWGPGWMYNAFFPFFLFLFSIPMGSVASTISFPLQLLVCKLVEIICHSAVLGIDIIRYGTQIIDPSGQYKYEVAAACSGLRSLIGISLFATVYGFLTFRPVWKRLLVMASAVPLAVVGNLLRMLVIVIASEMGGQRWGNWVHDSTYFSLVPYIPAIFGVLAFGRYLGDKKTPVPPDKGSNGTEMSQPALQEVG